ncbi:MAG: 50S ribosomal protein L31 [Candidatus Pacebacteria bacterium]|nr:50S ribosomal protein L31 [Candidatus Paceibacterota bacterium]
MQKNLHPNWHHNCQVTCACGNKFTTGSTEKTLEVDICSACHPFFTGEMKFVDRQGRVDKFRQRMKIAQQKQAAAKKKQAKSKTTDNKQSNSAKTYREILREKKHTLKKKNQ